MLSMKCFRDGPLYPIVEVFAEFLLISSAIALNTQRYGRGHERNLRPQAGLQDGFVQVRLRALPNDRAPGFVTVEMAVFDSGKVSAVVGP